MPGKYCRTLHGLVGEERSSQDATWLLAVWGPCKKWGGAPQWGQWAQDLASGIDVSPWGGWGKSGTWALPWEAYHKIEAWQLPQPEPSHVRPNSLWLGAGCVVPTLGLTNRGPGGWHSLSPAAWGLLWGWHIFPWSPPHASPCNWGGKFQTHSWISEAPTLAPATSSGKWMAGWWRKPEVSTSLLAPPPPPGVSWDYGVCILPLSSPTTLCRTRPCQHNKSSKIRLMHFCHIYIFVFY